MKDNELYHYGMPRRSGRYPWGSGENPYQRSADFLARVEKLEKDGLTDEKDLAKAMGVIDPKTKELIPLTTTQFRSLKSWALEERKQKQYDTVISMNKHGYNQTEIAEKVFGKKSKESTVRNWLEPGYDAKLSIATKTAKQLMEMIDEHGIIDVGKGVSQSMGITDTRMKSVLDILDYNGYVIEKIQSPNLTNPNSINKTPRLLVRRSDVDRKKLYDYKNIYIPNEEFYAKDGETLERKKVQKPTSVNSDRVEVTFKEDTNGVMDGTIELRRGVKDLSLGNSNYAQVRIMVDNKYYLKGMAIYSDDLPEGIDIRYNTSKERKVGKFGAMKKIKDDPENPFGARIKSPEEGGQAYYIDDKGNQQLSPINKTREEGEWDTWSHEVPSQFLSKQPKGTIKSQLNATIKRKEEEYENISNLNNPIIKKQFLADYAGKCDKAAVSLKAVEFTGQKYKVILPTNDLSDKQAYIPSLPEGQRVALVRYPHGGLFEIPILTNTHKSKEGQRIIGNGAADAIGINATVASILSGADFDGDTVQVIPLNDKTKIANKEPLEGLKGFDTKMSYGPEVDPKTHEPITFTDKAGNVYFTREGRKYKPLPEREKQKQMGIVSNLITDMTLRGANDDELARAVRHSMVIIDATKHNLDYKKSEEDNNIKQLKEIYQVHPDGKIGGASTLISLSSAERTPLERTPGAFFTKDGNKAVTLIKDKKGNYQDWRQRRFMINETGEVVTSDKVKKATFDPNTGESLWTYTDENHSFVKYKMNNGKQANATVYESNNGDLYYTRKDTHEKIKITDEKIYTEANKSKQHSSAMAETNDAFTLSSGTEQENLYAEYANKMKSMANRCRKDLLTVEKYVYSPAAAAVYQEEVASLNNKIKTSMSNKPKERKAQDIATSNYNLIMQNESGYLSEEEKNKIKQRELEKARISVGSVRPEFDITEREWEAIQARAISTHRLEEIIKYCDKDKLLELAMPKKTTNVTTGMVSRMKALINNGVPLSDVARIMQVSVSTVTKAVKN